MTRKDYQLFAEMLAELRQHYNGKALDMVETRMCSIFMRDNPRFDSIKFRDAARATSD